MAERKPARPRAAAKPPEPPQEERALTDYVVLRKLFLHGGTKLTDIYDLPQDEPMEPTSAALQSGVWLPVYEQDRESGKWHLRVVKAQRGDAAIDTVTGKGEGALVGQWKAVALSAWKGVTTVDPPLQVLQDQRTVSQDE